MRSYRRTCTTSWMKFCPCPRNYYPREKKEKEKKKKTKLDRRRSMPKKTFSLLLSAITFAYLLNLNSDRKREFGTKTILQRSLERQSFFPSTNCLTRVRVMVRSCHHRSEPFLKSIESFAPRIQLDYRPSCNSLPFD